MTAATLPAVRTARLFYSPRGLYDFQADGVAQLILGRQMLAVWSLGTGKTILAMAGAAKLFERGEIDRVLVVAELNKITDWAKLDFPKFTQLSTGLYLGPDRATMLDDPPDVLVTTYETARLDFVTFKPKSKAILAEGPLLGFLGTQRVLIVYDEATKLRNRSNKLYTAHAHALKRLRARKGNPPWVLGLTGTPLETGVQDYFNLVRLIDPARAGTVAQFEEHHVAARDFHGHITHFKNITPDRRADLDITPFVTKIAPLIHRKRKTDPDLRDQFPKKVEEAPTFIDLHPRHKALIRTVAETVTDSPSEEEALWMTLRQLAGHPAAVLHSKSNLGRMIVREVGEAGLRAIASAKTEELLDWALRLGDESGVVFTFYGQSILPELRDALTGSGYTVVVNHGGMTAAARQRAQDTFRSGRAQLFLSSDAGARGLNLQKGSALLHYEPSLTHANHEQRSDRIHRADSPHESVDIKTLVARGTPDEWALDRIAGRHEATEKAIDYDRTAASEAGALTAAARQEMIRAARNLR